MWSPSITSAKALPDCRSFVLLNRSTDGAKRFSVKGEPLESIWFGQQAPDQIVGKSLRDFRRGQRSIRAEPLDAPVQTSEDGTHSKSGIAVSEFTRSHACQDQIAHAFFIFVAFSHQVALLTGRQGGCQEVRGGSIDFVEYAPQVRRYYHAQLDRCAGSHAASLVKRGDHAVQGIVLAKEKNVLLTMEIVIKICRRKGCGCRDVAHASLREPAHAKLSARGAQDLQTPRQIAPLEKTVALIVCSAVWQLHSPAQKRQKGYRVVLPRKCPSQSRQCQRVLNNSS